MPHSKGQRGSSCLTSVRAALAPLLPAPRGVHAGDPSRTHSSLDEGLVPTQGKQSGSARRGLEAVRVQARSGGSLARSHIPPGRGVCAASGSRSSWGSFAESFALKNYPTFVSSGFPWAMRPVASADEAARLAGTWGQPPFPGSTCGECPGFGLRG